MIFTSLDFLIFYALLMVLLVLFKNSDYRQSILLISSYIFYGWWNPAFILLILVSSVQGWYFGLLIDRSSDQRKKSLYLIISLAISLSMLAYFKYFNFIIQTIFSMVGAQLDDNFNIILPVGISFFTFQTMSYGIDLKRGKIKVCKSLPQFMLFVAFFPQLVAGPIVRASEFLPQLHKKVIITRENILFGLQLFIGGAIQKVLFADNLSKFVDPVFSTPELYSAGTLWLAAVAYAVQIFCDFSGYSLMAIGVARTLGFHLPKNFDMPYVARSITDFWRRWHITLSFWLRDYLYVSLGGNRISTIRTYVNLLITMLLGGLWHGSSWNFVLWGMLHGLALASHKMWILLTMNVSDRIKEHYFYKVFAWGLTCIFLLLTWIPFRCRDFDQTISYLKGLMGNTSGIEWMNPLVLTVLSFVVLWHLLYLLSVSYYTKYPVQRVETIQSQIILGGVLLAFAMFAPLNTSPFIYFQF
ncbi:MAG: MBOAT family O-acyltransferase [Candidatus Thiodiazotropha sp. 6PLUC1]